MYSPNLTIDRFETDRFLNNLLSHGDKSRLAQILGVSLSEVSQRTNPAEEKPSDFFKFKRFLLALDSINPSAARLLLSDLNACVNASYERADLCQLAGSVAKETADLVDAKLNNAPVRIQRKEVLEVIAVATLFAAGLEVERKQEQISTPRRRVVKARRTG